MRKYPSVVPKYPYVEYIYFHHTLLIRILGDLLSLIIDSNLLFTSGFVWTVCSTSHNGAFRHSVQNLNINGGVQYDVSIAIMGALAMAYGEISYAVYSVPVRKFSS